VAKIYSPGDVSTISFLHLHSSLSLLSLHLFPLFFLSHYPCTAVIVRPMFLILCMIPEPKRLQHVVWSNNLDRVYLPVTPVTFTAVFVGIYIDSLAFIPPRRALNEVYCSKRDARVLRFLLNRGDAASPSP